MLFVVAIVLLSSIAVVFPVSAKVAPLTGQPLASGPDDNGQLAADTVIDNSAPVPVSGLTGGGVAAGAGSRTALIPAASISYITVDPSYEMVEVGGTLTFSAQGYDQDNNPIDALTYSWDCSDSTAGSIDPSTGEFTAGTLAGFYSDIIQATSGGVTGYTSVDVIIPWIDMDSGTYDDLNGVWGSSDRDVFAVGAGGTILHYDGTTWDNMTSNTSVDLFGVWGSSDHDVFAVGPGGTVLHYTGTDWYAMDSGTYDDLNGVWGTSDHDIFAVGYNSEMRSATIIHYNGSAWSLVDSSAANDSELHCIWGSSDHDVFAVGGSGETGDGVILHYDGNAWSTMPAGTASDLNGVWGSSDHDVFAVGVNGGDPGEMIILHYDGTAWSDMNSDFGNYSWNAVWGSSRHDVFAVGYFAIGHYDGDAWNSMYGDSMNELYGVWGSSPSNVFAVGYGGTILHYTYTPVLSSITVTPSSASVVVSGIQAFFAQGYDQYDNAISDITFVWNCTDDTAGSIDASSGLFTAGTAAGSYSDVIEATSDGVTGYASVTVSQGSSELSVANASGTYGGTVNLSATLTSGGSAVSGKVISFSLNRVSVGTAVTNGSGVATLTGISIGSISAGIHNGFIGASFAGDSDYAGSSSTANLTVNKVTTSLAVTNASGTYRGTVNLSATLTSGGYPLAGKSVNFSLNGLVYTTVTDPSGVAAIWVSLTGINAGAYPGYVGASFAGDTNYIASSGTGNLTVGQASTSLPAASASGTYGGTVNLSATLTSGGSAVAGKSIDFSLNGVSVGTAVTDGSGVATLTSVSLGGISPGAYPSYIGASFAGETNYAGSSSAGNLTVWGGTRTSAADKTATCSYSAQTVILTATVTSAAGTVNTGHVYFAVMLDRVTIGSPVASGTVSGGSAAAVFLLPGSTSPGTYSIWATYRGDTNLYPSFATAYLRVILAKADLQVASFNFPSADQSVDPRTLTCAVTVTNRGPNTARDATVLLFWNDPTHWEYHWISTQNLGDIPPGDTRTVHFAWVVPLASVVLQASVSSATDDPYPDNNVRYQHLYGFYVTAYTWQGKSHTFVVNRNGYGFKNQGGYTDWSLFEDVFGYNNVDWCYRCPLVGTVVDPIAWVFYETLFTSWIETGNCYGMSATSLLRYSGGWTGTYDIGTDFTLDDPTWRTIEKYSGGEVGLPVLLEEVSHWKDDPVRTLRGLEAAMLSPNSSGIPDPRILVLLDNASLHGHAVVPYRVVDTGAFSPADIYIYDNNFPGDATCAVHVDLWTHTWSYHHTGWVGNIQYRSDYEGSWGLLTVPLSLNYPQPILPYKCLECLLVAFVVGSANTVNTDSLGRSLGYQNGALVEQIPGGMQLRPLADSFANSSFPEAYMLPSGEYTTTLVGNGTGSATTGLFNSSGLLTFTSYYMTPTTRDTIALSQDGTEATLSTNSASEAYSAMFYRDSDNATREYAVSNTTMASGEKITLKVLDGGDSFEIVNDGAAKSYDLTLQQVGAAPGSVLFTRLTIGAQQSQVVHVRDWSKLGSTKVELSTMDLSGKIVGTETVQTNGDTNPPSHWVLIVVIIVIVALLAGFTAWAVQRRRKASRTSGE